MCHILMRPLSASSWKALCRIFRTRARRVFHRSVPARCGRSRSARSWFDPFEIPAHWPRSYGLDVGWNKTAAVWGAIDRSVGVAYLYTEHYRGKAEPSVHASAIKARGEWIPGVIDPASRGRGQRDGLQLMSDYVQLGLDVTPASNPRESGIYTVWERLSTGRLKVFRTMMNWQAEYRLYRRDDDGNIVKKYDHLMDATRYWCVSGIRVAKVQPVAPAGLVPAIADRAVGY